MTRTNNSSVLSGKRTDVPLQNLTADPGNPRRTKPDRDAHRRLVASIKAHGLLEPLIVRPDDGTRYKVIAGRRRLRALRDIFKGQNPKIPCTLKEVEGDAAGAVALAENFAREPMHPLDEAEAFAHLAKNDGKGAQDIAAQFGVTPAYVRQRMKLSALADVVKMAYRNGAVDMATAEAFSAVPWKRQEEIWSELKGSPHNAQQVRSRIDNAWLDAANAFFDIAVLPEGTVSRDLFGDRVLVERNTFIEHQGKALAAQQQALQEEGWKEVVVGYSEDLRDRMWSMDEAPVDYDKASTAKLAKLEQKRDDLEKQVEDIDVDTDGEKAEALQEKFEAADSQFEQAIKQAQGHYSEDTKAVATVFLILDAEGRVQRQYRVARATKGKGTGSEESSENGQPQPIKAPTPNDLSDPQLATLYTHQAVAVRAAMLGSSLSCKRVLVLMLHENVRSEALAIRLEANGTTRHTDTTEGFQSPALTALRTALTERDPFEKDAFVEDADAYEKLSKLSEAQLDDVIAILTVQRLTAHLGCPTPLVNLLAGELKVQVRQQWRPTDVWLNGYTKRQLSQLIGQLRGPVYGDAGSKAKKSELVAQAAALFADAAEGRLTDPNLAARVNAWLPENILVERPAKRSRKRAA